MISNARTYLLLILLSISLLLRGQADKLKFINIDITQGLSSNQITCIYKDNKEFMWIGTMSGLNRYDGYTFKVYQNVVSDSSSLNDNYIYKIAEDHTGKLWINTHSGFTVFNPETETFSTQYTPYLKRYNIPFSEIQDIAADAEGNTYFYSISEGLAKLNVTNKKVIVLKSNADDPQALYKSNISNIKFDSLGQIWLIYKDGTIEKRDKSTLELITRDHSFAKIRKETADYALFIDKDNDLWISSINSGLYCYNTQTHNISHIDTDSYPMKLSAQIIRSIEQDNTGIIWVGTDHGGITLIDKNKGTTSYLRHNTDDSHSIPENSITTLYKDKTGIIWIGTFKKGIGYYHPNIVRFKLNKHEASNPNSLPFDDVNCFVEDDKNNVWIGTNGGGLLYYDRQKESYLQYKHNPQDPSSLSSDIIVSLCIDSQDKLWIGTYFGGLNRLENNRFVRYKHDPSKVESIANDNVWEIFEDSNNNLWIGTLGNGLDRFDREKNTFYHKKANDLNSVNSNYISSISEDREGNLWIGTAGGVNMIEKTSGKFIHYAHQNFGNCLSNNNTNAIIQDSRGFVWIGTREGLNRFDLKTKKFKVFRESDGLPNSNIVTLAEDRNGNLWIGTSRGLSNLIITKTPQTNTYSYTFKNYDELDGLQGKEFNESSVLKTRRGELFFGGANGFNVFVPNDIKTNTIPPAIAFTGLHIFNKTIKPGEILNGRQILTKSIENTHEITLKHKENVISIEFAALSYFQPEKNKFLYRLEGFNEEWLSADAKTRRITYTNLDPGTYTLSVKASNNDGFWNNKGISLKIHILPPFWRTNFAFVLYFLTIMGLLFLSRKILLDRARMRFNLEQERSEAQRRHELDMLKIKFFTNVSHEFRTPLTLIISPLEKLIRTIKDPDINHQHLLIYRNSKRLLNLVNQLLDFRRMEVQEFKLHPEKGNMIAFINDICSQFSDLSEKKNIELTVTSDVKSLVTSFDHDKLEKILFNLLSNAFKFTPEGGHVNTSVALTEQLKSPGKWIQIKVSDTGIGIPKEKHEKIFERFFQNEVPGTILNQGSGIGLALTHEFVKLHNGTITVDSEPDKGSTFTVLLPIAEEYNASVNNDLATDTITTTVQGSLTEEVPTSRNARKATLLLVEDNDDFRFYLKDNLKEFFNIQEASNGKDAISNALTTIPDLIVSDVMMPVMDGIEFCKQIKTTKQTSHIPVILLTAKTTNEQIVEGFETGADDYVTKPFNFEILLSRIRNLIKQRESMRKTFNKQIQVEPSEITVTSLDEKLIQKAIALIEKNISNPDFSVEELSKELGMSRVHLYKKLTSITGKSPIEFIRILRLKRAAQLLQKSQLSISEIAYEVGFNNPKYFAKYFKAEFNKLPSQYISDFKNNNPKS
jgi:signal transduction histidine kinase/ligand-binding sensor domain-containing protein/DNA-binding response OmpR family regulator